MKIRARNETEIRWDDLRFPASAINPPGAASDPTLDPNDGCWLFDSATTELLYFQIQFPHKWLLESTISPHVHWGKYSPGAGTVAWRMRYQIAKLGDNFPGVWTDLGIKTTVLPAFPDTNSREQHLITELGDIDMTGITNVSTMMKVELSRVGASDTYAADAKLYEFDIHIQIDDRGSTTEYVK